MIIIQIVDTNPDFRESVGSLLEVYGYEVWTSAEEGEALAELDAHPRHPSIILVETEQAQHARQFTDAVHARDASITVFYTLMYGSSVRLDEMTLDNVLTKPFMPVDLIHLIEHELEHHHGTGLTVS